MKLFTKEINNKLFAQYSKGNDLANQMVVAKIFNPYGRGVWYLLNSDPEDPDYIWAIVDLFEVEVGSVSRSELESIKVPPFRLGLERDTSFRPINAQELFKGVMGGKRYEDGGNIDDSDAILFGNGGSIGSLHYHKHNPSIIFEILDYTNKGVKGLQKNPKSLSRKERNEGIITFYSTNEFRDLFEKEKYAKGGGVEKQSYSNWEENVANSLSDKLEISFGDAQGIIMANEFYMAQAWGKGLNSEEAADYIDSKTTMAQGGSVGSDYESDVDIRESEGVNYLVPPDAKNGDIVVALAKGGNIKTIERGNEYRYLPNSSIEKDILAKVDYIVNKTKFAGNYYVKGHKNDTFIYFLDEFDRNLVKDITLKLTERIYRSINRSAAISGISSLVKINLENGLVYSLTNESVNQGNVIEFVKRGEQTQYLNLVQVDEDDYYEDGGKVSSASKPKSNDYFSDFDINYEGNFAATINGKNYEIIYRDDISEMYDLFANGVKVGSDKNLRNLMSRDKYAKGGAVNEVIKNTDYISNRKIDAVIIDGKRYDGQSIIDGVYLRKGANATADAPVPQSEPIKSKPSKTIRKPSLTTTEGELLNPKLAENDAQMFESKFGVSVKTMADELKSYDNKSVLRGDAKKTYQSISGKELIRADIDEFYKLLLGGFSFNEIKLGKSKAIVLPNFEVEDSTTGVRINIKPQYKKPLNEKGFLSLKNVVGTDILRTTMSCIYFDDGNLVATDSWKLVIIKKTQTDSEIKEIVKTIIKKDVNKIAAGKEAEKIIDSRLSLIFKDGLDKKAVNMFSGELEIQKYPNYQGVIPKNNDYTESISIQSLIDACNGVFEVVNNCYKAIGNIRLDFINGQEQQEIAFNSEYLLETLQVLQVNGAKSVKLSPSTPTRGCGIYADNGNYALLMPVMLSNNAEMICNYPISMQTKESQNIPSESLIAKFKYAVGGKVGGLLKNDGGYKSLRELNQDFKRIITAPKTLNQFETQENSLFGKKVTIKLPSEEKEFTTKVSAEYPTMIKGSGKYDKLYDKKYIVNKLSKGGDITLKNSPKKGWSHKSK